MLSHMHPRFYLENLGGRERIELPVEVVRHLHVLGLKPGDRITLFDGSGVEALARIEELSRRDGEATVLSHRRVSREPGVRVTLACAVPKGRRMDTLVRMCAELGVYRIVPLVTRRSVVKPSDVTHNRDERRRAICIAAAEQSGRNRITRIDPPATLEEFLERDDRDMPTALLSPDEDAPTLPALLAEHPHAESLALVIGPEGGFTDEELALARSVGVRFARLAPSVLRIETAAVSAVAITVATFPKPL